METSKAFRRFAAKAAVACAAVSAVPAAHADTQTRAETVATMQQLAAAIEPAYALVAPMLRMTSVPRLRVAVEHGLATLDTALTAYSLADQHDARAQSTALNNGEWEDAADAIVARAENALTLGNYARCEELAQLLVQLADDTHDERLRMYADAYLGILDRRHANFDAAIQHQQQALHLAKEIGDDVEAGRALAHLGTIYRDRGDFAQALDLQMQALALGEKTGDRIELTYRNLALLYRELGDENTGRVYFEKAISAAEHTGEASHFATVYGSYSGFLNDNRDFVNALQAATETLALDQVLNDRPAVAFEQLERGRALVGLKRSAEAVVPLQAALQNGRAINQREIVVRSQLALAEIATTRGDNSLARTLLEEAIGGLDVTRMKPQLAQAYALRGQLAEAEGDTKTALRFARDEAVLREDLLGSRASRRLSALEVQHARAASEQKLAMLTIENELQAARLEQHQLQRRFYLAGLLGLAILVAALMWRMVSVRRLNRALAASSATIEKTNAELSEANARLQRQADELYQTAITDPLTGVFNRGQLLRAMQQRIDDCEKSGRDLALMLIDFDNFKQINDARGHLFGDRVLVAGVQTLRQWLEPGDLLGRFGGEEFIAIVEGQNIFAVRAMAERIRVRVADTLAVFAPELARLATISIGISTASQINGEVTVEQLIDSADRALYAAKAAGRNRVATLPA
jgi:diguanylate cyclase (GGDEF)-like protein